MLMFVVVVVVVVVVIGAVVVNDGFGDHQVTCSLAFIEPVGLLRTNCVRPVASFRFQHILVEIVVI